MKKKNVSDVVVFVQIVTLMVSVIIVLINKSISSRY